MSGTVAKLRGQLTRGLGASLFLPLLISVFCVLPAVMLLNTSGVAYLVSVYALIGVALPSIGAAMVGTSTTVSDIEQPRPVRAAITLVFWVYLNVMFIVAFVAGYAAAESVSLGAATFAAISVPYLDQWLAGRGVPTVAWITRLVVSVILLVTKAVERFLDREESFSDALQETMSVFDSPDEVLAQFGQRVTATARLWV